MPAEFIDDIEYLAKIVLITFIVLSLIIIYNQKFIEGLLLISICIQFILIWILIRKYKVTLEIKNFKSSIEDENNSKYIFLIIGIIIFILGINFIFRGVAIVQHSIMTYDVLKNDYYSDLVFSISIGILLFVISLIMIIIGSKSIKNDRVEHVRTKDKKAKFSKIS